MMVTRVVVVEVNEEELAKLNQRRAAMGRQQHSALDELDNAIGNALPTSLFPAHRIEEAAK